MNLQFVRTSDGRTIFLSTIDQVMQTVGTQGQQWAMIPPDNPYATPWLPVVPAAGAWTPDNVTIGPYTVRQWFDRNVTYAPLITAAPYTGAAADVVADVADDEETPGQMQVLSSTWVNVHTGAQRPNISTADAALSLARMTDSTGSRPWAMIDPAHPDRGPLQPTGPAPLTGGVFTPDTSTWTVDNVRVGPFTLREWFTPFAGGTDPIAPGGSVLITETMVTPINEGAAGSPLVLLGAAALGLLFWSRRKKGA